MGEWHFFFFASVRRKGSGNVDIYCWKKVIMASLALVQLWIAAALLLVLVQTQALGMGKYSRLVSYQGEIVVRW